MRSELTRTDDLSALVQPHERVTWAVTVEEFLHWEMAREDFHELWGGEVRARPLSSYRHARLTTDLSGALANALGDGSCENFGPLLLLMVRESGSVFHPDGVIACPPNWYRRERGAIDNPTVLFEVVTPESEARDRGERFEHYALLPSLRQYVLISTEARQIEAFSRGEGGDWRLETYRGDASVPLVVGIELPLGELYRKTDV
jgi:Uma2 family endonuclease